MTTSVNDDAAGMPLRAPRGDEAVYAWVSRTQEVIAFRLDGELLACSAICPHMGARLTLDRSRRALVCPWHGLVFALPGGESDHPRYRRVRCFRATERDGHVELG